MSAKVAEALAVEDIEPEESLVAPPGEAQPKAPGVPAESLPEDVGGIEEFVEVGAVGRLAPSGSSARQNDERCSPGQNAN